MSIEELKSLREFISMFSCSRFLSQLNQVGNDVFFVKTFPSGIMFARAGFTFTQVCGVKYLLVMLKLFETVWAYIGCNGCTANMDECIIIYYRSDLISEGKFTSADGESDFIMVELYNQFVAETSVWIINISWMSGQFHLSDW